VGATRPQAASMAGLTVRALSAVKVVGMVSS
jgi:hypothetical protein